MDYYFKKDGGEVFAYLINEKNKIKLYNYFSLNSNSKSNADLIIPKYKNVLLLRNLFVDENKRGLGTGRHLLEKVISVAKENEIEAIVLIADTLEKQLGEFNLVNWYESFGFKKIKDVKEGILMVFEI